MLRIAGPRSQSLIPARTIPLRIHIARGSGPAASSRSVAGLATDKFAINEYGQGRIQLLRPLERSSHCLMCVSPRERIVTLVFDPAQDLPRVLDDRVCAHHGERRLGVRAEILPDFARALDCRSCYR